MLCTLMASACLLAPCYGSDSYLAFAGNAADYVLKGQWQLLDLPIDVTVQQPNGAVAPERHALHRREALGR